MDAWTRDLQLGYDRVAGEYAAHIFDELSHKPLDRELLDRFAAIARPLGPVCDLGCGPGHVARYLYECGLAVSGLDLSQEMVARARALNPSITFRQGTMLALDFDDASLGGLTAFYSIIHVPRDRQPVAFEQMRRVLRPGGALLIAFHLGAEDLHLAEWWGERVSIDFLFFSRAAIEERLKAAGFVIEESIERLPYPDVEHQSHRAYILARRPIPRPPTISG